MMMNMKKISKKKLTQLKKWINVMITSQITLTLTAASTQKSFTTPSWRPFLFSTTPLIEKVKDTRSIKRLIFDFDDNKLFVDLVWSDPSINSNELYHKNTRGRRNSFNGVAVITFLKRNNPKRLIRGHEYIQDGVGKLFNEKCITVFSCSSYKKDMGNSSGILKVSQKDDLVEPIVFQPLHRLEKYDANYFKVQMFNSHQCHSTIFFVMKK